MESDLNAKQKWIVVLLDIVVLAELTACLGYAAQFPDALTMVFLASYIPTVLTTLFFGKRIIRRYRTAEATISEAVPPAAPDTEQPLIKLSIFDNPY